MPNKTRKKSSGNTKITQHPRITRKNHHTIPKKEQSSQKKVQASVETTEVKKNIPEARSAEKLEAEYNEMKTTLTQKRKAGKDTFIEDMKMMLIPTKIQYLKADNNEKVYAFVKDLLQEIRASIQEMDTADADSAKQVIEKAQNSQS